MSQPNNSLKYLSALKNRTIIVMFITRDTTEIILNFDPLI